MFHETCWPRLIRKQEKNKIEKSLVYGDDMYSDQVFFGANYSASENIKNSVRAESSIQREVIYVNTPFDRPQGSRTI